MSKKVFTAFKHLTRHAQIRMQQRGKNSEAVKLIGRYGTYNPDTQNITLRRKQVGREIERRKRWLARLSAARPKVAAQIRRRIKTLERCAGCAIVVSESSIVTVYNRTRRIRQRQYHRRRHRR